MDLSYGGEFEAFRGEVEAFLSANWPPSGDAAQGSREEQANRFRQKATDAGYLNRNIPRQYGGSEQPVDPLKAAVISEEFTRARAPMEPRGIGTMMLVPTLLDRGEEWQKEKFVRATILGELTWCQGYSEPGSGSDLASLKTKGELVGDEWVINGQKIWTSSAMEADYMFCLVRTEPDAKKHAGISYLLIDMKAPGIDVRPLRMMTGSSEFNEVFFNDVKTPKDWIVGKRGEGWLVSRTTLKHERSSIGAASQTVGLLNGLVELARERKIDGRPAIEDTSIRRGLAELEGYVRAHLYSGYFQMTKGLKGENPGVIQMMTKLNSTNMGHMVSKLAMEILGDDGLVAPGPYGLGMGGNAAEHWVAQYMSSVGVAIAGGTANVQRNVIAERGFGLPRDSAANRSK
ncbi:MAG: acyl-CoA dehydrogenase [bacterium]|nr:acyl-CoA dehydrogenase [Deltaproteobacteria bacterium]MCP4903758.1 acyl-CoA dehydrogenase [bacterium]